MGGPTDLDPMLLSSIAVGLAVFTLALLFVVAVRQARLLRRYRQILNGSSERNLEQMLIDQSQLLQEGLQRLRLLQGETDELARQARLHLQRVGIIRFNAFPDTGSDLSFATALLDGQNNGLVISSLYGRSESRIYAKPIQAGKSTYALSDEEKAALAKAMGEQN